MPNEQINKYRKEGIKSLFEIPKEHKIFKTYQILGDREISTYFIIYPNNFLIGTCEGWSRIFVGKIGEKDCRNRAELTLFYLDYAHLLSYLGEDFSKVEFFKLTKYRETMILEDNCTPVFYGSFGKCHEDMNLPESNGNLYDELKENVDDYIKGCLTSYIY